MSCNIFSLQNPIRECNHGNESFLAVILVLLFMMLCKVVLTFDSVDEILKCDHWNESY